MRERQKIFCGSDRVMLYIPSCERPGASARLYDDSGTTHTDWRIGHTINVKTRACIRYHGEIWSSHRVTRLRISWIIAYFEPSLGNGFIKWQSDIVWTTAEQVEFSHKLNLFFGSLEFDLRVVYRILNRILYITDCVSLCFHLLSSSTDWATFSESISL